MNSLIDTREFGKLKIMKRNTQRQPEKAIHTHKNACKTDVQLLCFQPSREIMLILWEEMYRLWQDQSHTCTVKIEHNNKHKMCKFFVVLVNGQTLLGMSDINVLNIIIININTIYAVNGRHTYNCCTNKATPQSTNKMQETDSISKSDNTKKTMVNNKLSNTVDYFFPGPYHDNNKRVSAKIMQQLKRDFEDVVNGIGCFDGTFHYS